MQYGKIPIMIAAADERRELVEILLARTKQIPSIPDWSVDGIIRTIKYQQLETQVCMLAQFSKASKSIEESILP
jgi:hypothetical protein